MSTLREAAEKALAAMSDAAFDEDGYIMDPDLAEARDELRAALAKPDAPSAAAGWPSADEIAQEIRRADGANRMGAGALGERLAEWLAAAPRPAPAAPQPAGGEREALADELSLLLEDEDLDGDKLESAAADLLPRIHDHLRAALSTQPAAQPQPTGDFADALAAVDNTLHGAIDHWQDRALNAEAALSAQAAELEALRVDAETWKALYRRALNAANGLTNYVEDRPELSRIERELVAIEAAARAALKEQT